MFLKHTVNIDDKVFLWEYIDSMDLLYILFYVIS